MAAQFRSQFAENPSQFFRREREASKGVEKLASDRVLKGRGFSCPTIRPKKNSGFSSGPQKSREENLKNQS
jgi:hypothetical protein